jgi:hypothetical protein
MLRAVNDYSDINRLCLLITLDLTGSNVKFTVHKLRRDNLRRPSKAIELSSNLKDILPDADPIYLDLVGEVFVYDENGLSEFIEKVTTKKKTYPKLQEYNDRIKLISIIKSLTEDFQVEEYLKICPDPIHYFKNVKLNSSSYHHQESMSYLSKR